MASQNADIKELQQIVADQNDEMQQMMEMLSDVPGAIISRQQMNV